MTILDLVMLSLGIAMDASCVAISDTLAYRQESIRRLFALPIVFALFHGFMPVLGYLAGGVAAEFIESYAGIIALVILAIVGGNMIREGVEATLRRRQVEPQDMMAHLTWGIVLAQGFAVAIDSFAVGISLRALNVNLFLAGLVITVVTFLACSVAVAIGRRPGKLLGNHALIVGGVVVVAMGVHLFFG